MEIILTTEIIIMLCNGIAGIISIVITWQKLNNKVENLANKISQNETGDNELKKKVESLEILHTDIRIMEKEFKDQRVVLQNSLHEVKETISILSNKIEALVSSQSKLFTEIEVLKKTKV